MSEFFRTVMGRQFIDGTMPRVATALERIAAALEEQNARARARDAVDAEAAAAVAFSDRNLKDPSQ